MLDNYRKDYKFTETMKIFNLCQMEKHARKESLSHKSHIEGARESRYRRRCRKIIIMCVNVGKNPATSVAKFSDAKQKKLSTTISLVHRI